MLTRFVALSCAVLAIGCGSTEPLSSQASPSEASSIAATSASGAFGDATADAKPAPVATKADARADVKKGASANDPLKKALAEKPGDVVVVFTNNVDGEIEPCG